MKYIYVVFAGSGEYEEYRERPVKAFGNQHIAEHFCTQIEKIHDRLWWCWHKAIEDAEERDDSLPDIDVRKGSNRLDREMDIYEETNYFIQKVRYQEG